MFFVQWFGQSINFYWQIRAKGSSIFRKIIPYFLVRTLLEGMRTKWLIDYVGHSINLGFKRCKRIYWLDESSFHCPYFILAWNGFNGPRGHSSRWYLRVLWKTIFTSFTLLWAVFFHYLIIRIFSKNMRFIWVRDKALFISGKMWHIFAGGTQFDNGHMYIISYLCISRGVFGTKYSKKD